VVRLFVAVALPEPVLAVLRSWPRPELAAVRYTAEAQWHVTLRFLGEVEGPAAVSEALVGVPGLLAPGDRPLPAVLGPAVSWFPGRHVLQVPVTGLEDLAAAVGQVTEPWGAPPEVPFRGHVTLARSRGRRPGPRQLAGAPMAAAFAVDEVLLCSSVPGPGGSVYEVRSRLALAGGVA